MKNVIYIIAVVGAIVLFAIGKDLEFVSIAIMFVLSIYSKYAETQAQKSEERTKQTFHKAMGMSVSDYEELK